MFRALVPCRILSLFLLVTGCVLLSPAQRIVDKNKGDHNQTRSGLMDGNLVATVYYNFGEVADWENQPSLSGVWPKGTNHTYVDGVAIIVQAEAKDPSGRTIHPLETNYYEYTRADNAGVTYGWWPLPGYASRTSRTPAQSTDPGSWPEQWPDRPSDWNGTWNGFFGKNILNADLESYFVFDDNEDREYILKNNFHPDADDASRGGLGMQVRARGFQWSQVLAEDVIFWYYEITNMGTTDYPKTLFAQYVDWGIGGHDNSSNNAGSYNKQLNISYSWSTVSYGSPGQWTPVGYCGYAFLESPGISDDRGDNDQDGLTDERRDNIARTFITDPVTDPFLRDVQSDTLRFRLFYGYSWKPHWDADENCNWRPMTDLNGNGTWDEGEPLNDDVGSDGIGPLDEDHTDPDGDGTEANGRPDQGEPNFGQLDKDESDQLGLTGFLISAVHTYDLNNDEKNWGALSALPAPPDQQPSLVGVNLANHFSSYLFHLNGRNTYSGTTGTIQETGETERFSMALIFGLNVDDLFRRKRTVQQIYNANYNFAKPPDKPTVKAVPGDGRVTLYWDNRSELTFDAFYQKYNFEGYRIYRSTEPNFIEPKTITDAFGTPTYRTPIVQFDLADGIKGLHPIDVNGAKFNLGTDNGLQHAFIDSTVQNGQTYYYAVVAYDQGFTTTTVEGEFIGIPPSETTSIIKVDANGNIKTDINTAAVTPRAPAAGYIKPEQHMIAGTGPGTGSVGMTILDPKEIKDQHVYRLSFVDSTAFHTNPNPSYQVIDQTSGDTVLHLTKIVGEPEVTPVMQGFSIAVNNDPRVLVDRPKTGWTTGSSNNFVDVGFDPRYLNAYAGRRVDYPADFEIVFKGAGQGDTSFPALNGAPRIPTDISVRNVTENKDHWQFLFRDNNSNQLFDAGDAIFMVSGDSAGKPAPTFLRCRISWSVTLVKDTTIAEALQRPPQPGDVFHIATTKPFRTAEYYDFQTKGEGYSKEAATAQLQNIAVVPNPYVGAASWEQATATVGRGQRLIYFVHLPRSCKIRIYTISGHLVQTLTHESSIDDGQEAWNLVSRDGMDISYGIYVYHVDAGELGTRIDRFAVLK